MTNYKIWVTESVPYLVRNVNSLEAAKEKFYEGDCEALREEVYVGDIESIEKQDEVIESCD